MVTDLVLIACSAIGGALIGATVTHLLESGRNRKSERRILQIMTDNTNHAVDMLNKDINRLSAENSKLSLENKELRIKLQNKLV